MGDISRLFFDRFTANQGDWTQDHSYIFEYASEPSDLTKQYADVNIESFAKTFRVLVERQATMASAQNSYLEFSQDGLGNLVTTQQV